MRMAMGSPIATSFQNGIGKPCRYVLLTGMKHISRYSSTPSTAMADPNFTETCFFATCRAFSALQWATIVENKNMYAYRQAVVRTADVSADGGTQG